MPAGRLGCEHAAPLSRVQQLRELLRCDLPASTALGDGKKAEPMPQTRARAKWNRRSPTKTPSPHRWSRISHLWPRHRSTRLREHVSPHRAPIPPWRFSNVHSESAKKQTPGSWSYGGYGRRTRPLRAVLEYSQPEVDTLGLTELDLNDKSCKPSTIALGNSRSVHRYGSTEYSYTSRPRGKTSRRRHCTGLPPLVGSSPERHVPRPAAPVCLQGLQRNIRTGIASWPAGWASLATLSGLF